MNENIHEMHLRSKLNIHEGKNMSEKNILYLKKLCQVLLIKNKFKLKSNYIINQSMNFYNHETYSL